jgi:hypothetical protein
MSANMPHEQFMISIVAIIAVFGLPFLGLVIWIITHYACATFKAWQDTALKRDMVARGYSVQEIIEVISAKRGSKPNAHLPNVPPAKPIQKPAFSP